MRGLFLPLLLLATASTPSVDWPGRPTNNPPGLHQKGPPPAWIETKTRSTWLAWGSYCWTTLCVDMILPSMRNDIPRVSVQRGAAVRIHLAFVPRTVSIVVGQGDRSRTLQLRAKRVLVWRPQFSGLATVTVRAPQGDAGYLARVRITAAR